MKKLLRSLLLAAVVGAGSLTASAQSETFTGQSGNKYYVDYEKGLVLQLDEKSKVANLVSPQWVVETEITPAWDRLYYLADLNDRTYEILTIYKNRFKDAMQYAELTNEDYYNVIENFQSQSKDMLALYESALERLEAAKDDILQTRQGKETRAVEHPTYFSFNINSAFLSLQITELYTDFFADDVERVGASVEDLIMKVEENSVDIDDMSKFYADLLQTSADRVYKWLDWLDEYQDNIDEDDVDYVIDIIEEEIINLKVEMEYPQVNPMDYINAWIEACTESLDKAAETYDYTYQTAMEAAQRVAEINNNFTGVLFAGAYGEEFGMYYYMIDNNGQLILPNYVTTDEVDYRVIGAQSNIFSCVPADFNMEGASLVMPETIRQIHNEAFAIDGLVAVYVPTPECPVIDANCFTTQVYSTATLYVTDGWVSAYKAREPWKNFFAIEPISSTGVEDAIAESELVKVEGGNIVVNAASGANVTVYKVDGSVIYNGEAGVISLPNKGMYIVKVNNKTVKVIL